MGNRRDIDRGWEAWEGGKRGWSFRVRCGPCCILFSGVYTTRHCDSFTLHKHVPYILTHTHTHTHTHIPSI